MSQAPSDIFTDADQKVLLEVARRGISHELYQYVPLHVKPADFPAPLREVRATFVTLKIEGNLRGCIGTLEARRPLIVDVVHNAGAAAFADPRFARVTRAEFDQISIEISVLGPPQSIGFASEDDLIARLRRGIDGLILTEGDHRGTFLPAVWEQLPDPRQFVEHLKAKAGLPRDYWSDTIRMSRYTTESFS